MIKTRQTAHNDKLHRIRLLSFAKWVKWKWNEITFGADKWHHQRTKWEALKKPWNYILSTIVLTQLGFCVLPWTLREWLYRVDMMVDQNVFKMFAYRFCILAFRTMERLALYSKFARVFCNIAHRRKNALAQGCFYWSIPEIDMEKVWHTTWIRSFDSRLHSTISSASSSSSCCSFFHK